MKFRQATVSDIDEMSKIRLSVTENPLTNPDLITPQMYSDYLAKLGRGWVCEIDNQIIGFSFADIENHSIWALFVYSEYEGKGVGKGLLQLATQWLFNCGATKITLETEANTRADKFYQAQGWTRGEIKNQYDVAYTLMLENKPI